MFRFAALILSGNAATSGLLLARNLIVARLIPIEDYGIAATLAIAMSVVEMMSALGLQQQIVQSHKGDNPNFQAALQGFQVLRGFIAATTLVLLAGPIAAFMGVPQAAWAYRVMAVVPMLNALMHFDIYRLNRQMVFLPMILTGVLPALISVAALWPLSRGFGDYKVMLYAIVVQSLLSTVISHVVARQPYRLVLDRAIMAESLRFGWPILINGALLFAVFNGDKVIVGRELGMTQLAVFAMGFTLIQAPLLVLEKTAQSFFLPQLSSLRNEGEVGWFRYVDVAVVAAQAHLFFGLAMILGVAFFGSFFVNLLLGAKYASLIGLLPWLAVMQVLRSLKGATSPMCLAQAQTELSMYVSLPRVLGLFPAFYIAARTGDIILVIWVAILAELLGLGLTLWFANARLRLPLRPLIVPCLAVLGMGFIVALDAWVATETGEPSALTRFALLILGGLGLTMMPELRHYFRMRGRGKT